MIEENRSHVLNIVTFLCSQQASLVNGASILVDGDQSHSL